MIDQNLILSKIRSIQSDIENLRSFQKYSFEEIDYIEKP